jgi:hypothetical protein
MYHWIDVFPLGTGFGYVKSKPGAVAAFRDETLLWERDVPETDIVRYIRGAAAPDGTVVGVGQGGDNNAWLVSASGTTNMGMAAGQDPIAILHDGEGFVVYRTVSGNEYAEDKAGRTTLHSMPLTSQGIREVYIGGGIDFGDAFLVETKIQGYTFWRRAQKNGFVGGQSANGKGEGLGLLELATGKYMWVGPFTMAESPHFAVNGDKVAIVAFTNGGAFNQVWQRPFPHEPVFQQTPDEPKPPVEEPKPPMAEPASLKDLVLEIRGTEPITDINKTGEMLNKIAWEGNKRIGKIEWGLSAKPGGHGTKQPKTGIRIAADILHHKPTNVLYDVFGGATNDNGTAGPTTPGWGTTPFHNDPNRPWVSPVEPEDGQVEPEPEDPDVEEPETPDEDEPSLEDLADLIAEAISEKIEATLNAKFAALSKKLDRAYEGKLFGARITFKPVDK